MPTTTNKVILDRMVRHRILLEQYRDGSAARVDKFLREQVLPDLRAQVIAGLDNIEGTDAQVGHRLQRLIRATKEILDPNLDELYDKELRELIDLSDAEAAFNVGVLRSSVPVEWAVTAPTPSRLRQIVVARPFNGGTLRDWYNGLSQSTQTRIDRQLKIGLFNGEDIGKITRRLNESLNITRRDATTITRTSVLHVSNQAAMETYRANDDLISGEQQVSTLDTRTSPICRELDGKVWKIGEGPRPPHHMNCRSFVIPVIKSFRELGIPADELPPSTRASMNGQVAERMTYNEWLAKQSDEVQDEVLGKTRAMLYRSGKVSIDRFTNEDGKLLTLKELREKEGLD